VERVFSPRHCYCDSHSTTSYLEIEAQLNQCHGTSISTTSKLCVYLGKAGVAATMLRRPETPKARIEPRSSNKRAFHARPGSLYLAVTNSTLYAAMGNLCHFALTPNTVYWSNFESLRLQLTSFVVLLSCL